jgi:alpha-N-arabinofuranosidase
MVLTPTYHVFDLYKGHQDSTLIESYVQQDTIGTEEAQVPAVHVSASENADGIIHVTLANLSAKEPQNIRCLLSGKEFSSIGIRSISGDMNEHNDFNQAPKVYIKTMDGVRLNEGGFTMKMPPCSVVEIVLT